MSKLPTPFSPVFRAYYLIHYDHTAHMLTLYPKEYNFKNNSIFTNPTSLIDLIINTLIAIKWLTIWLLRRVVTFAFFFKEYASIWLLKWKLNKRKFIQNQANGLSKILDGDKNAKNWSNVKIEEMEVAIWVNSNYAKNAIIVSRLSDYSEFDLDHPLAASWSKVYFVIGFYLVGAQNAKMSEVGVKVIYQ